MRGRRDYDQRLLQRHVQCLPAGPASERRALRQQSEFDNAARDDRVREALVDLVGPPQLAAKLFVTDSIMDHNGISTTTGAGIVVLPAPESATAQAANTKLVNNSVGWHLFSSGPMLVAEQGGMAATNGGQGVHGTGTRGVHCSNTKGATHHQFVSH